MDNPHLKSYAALPLAENIDEVIFQLQQIIDYSKATFITIQCDGIFRRLELKHLKSDFSNSH